jgi:hypothetical protein
LKNLHIFSYGLSSLPEEFKNLKKLEVLDLSSNNFTEIPEILTPENFPNLKSLSLNNSRITQSAKDLSKITKGDSIGLYLKSSVDGKDNPLRKLLLWEKLEELDISNCYIEGSLPDFKVGEDGVKRGFDRHSALSGNAEQLPGGIQDRRNSAIHPPGQERSDHQQ